MIIDAYIHSGDILCSGGGNPIEKTDLKNRMDDYRVLNRLLVEDTAEQLKLFV